MSDALLIWSLPTAIALHNLEETIWLPRWSAGQTSRWRRPVSTSAFRFATAVLTLTALAIAAWTQAAGVGSLGHYLLASYALGQALNVIFPHAVATIATRTYAPGLLSGLLCVLPSAGALLTRAFAKGQLKPDRLALTALVFIPMMLALILLLFKIGRTVASRTSLTR